MNSLLKTFQQFKSVLCICPHCSELLRLSDIQNLRTTKHAPRTWLDDYDVSIKKIERRDELVGEKENRLNAQESDLSEIFLSGFSI